MIKKISLIIGVFLMLLSCSIEREPKSIFVLGPEITQNCIDAGVNEEYPYGGCFISFWNNGQLTNTIFISNGAPGKDGINGIDGIDGQDGVSATVNLVEVQPSEEYPWGGYLLTIGVGTDVRTVFISNGANGIDGIDGQDGVSVTVRTEVTEGGTILIITTIDGEIRVFIKDGQDGQNGLDGIDGIDGQDGISSTIRTEVTEGGYNLYITVNNETTMIFIANGIDGTDGYNGTDGLDGIDGIDGQDGISSTIRTEEVQPSDEHPYGGYYLYITVGDTTTRIFVSNGADGKNGLDGEDGFSSSIRVEVYEGEYCDYGGFVIITSSTDPTVDDEYNYICNCECEVEEDPCDVPETKVWVCHKEEKSNSNTKEGYHNIYIPQSAVQAHLNHGDTLGKCEDE